jgi:maltooligosyltrehalose trehalohydrolase
MSGDRLSATLNFEQQKLAAAAVLLSPFVPLLFMGEEYGETAPFQYFISHTEPALVEAVRAGRTHEFAAQGWKGKPPDPQDPATFHRCKLNRALAQEGRHRVLRQFYGELLRLRKALAPIGRVEKETMQTFELDDDDVLMVRQWHDRDEVLLLANFSHESRSIELPVPAGSWSQCLDTAAASWAGPGSTMPQELASSGRFVAALPATALLVYRQQQLARAGDRT